jgi:hypothetical protein
MFPRYHSQTRQPYSDRSEQTERDHIALKPVPINLVTVELDQSPILCKWVGEGNGRGVDNVTKNTRYRRAPVLGDISMERGDLLSRLLRLRQFALELLARICYPSIFTLYNLPQRLNLHLVVTDEENMVPNLGHHNLEGVNAGLIAKDENRLTRHDIILTVIELILTEQRESEMTGGQQEDPVTLATLVEV